MNYNKKNNNGWILCPSKSFPGKFYYFNVKNGEAVWNLTESDKQTLRKDIAVPKVKNKSIYPEPKCPPENNTGISLNKDTSYKLHPNCSDEVKKGTSSEPNCNKVLDQWSSGSQIFGQGFFPKYISNVNPYTPNVMWIPVQLPTPMLVTNVPEVKKPMSDQVTQTQEFEQERLVQATGLSLSERFHIYKNNNTNESCKNSNNNDDKISLNEKAKNLLNETGKLEKLGEIKQIKLDVSIDTPPKELDKSDFRLLLAKKGQKLKMGNSCERKLLKGNHKNNACIDIKNKKYVDKNIISSDGSEIYDSLCLGKFNSSTTRKNIRQDNNMDDFEDLTISIDWSLYEKLKQFQLKSKVIEDRITLRADEWICTFTQIMENLMVDLLRDESVSNINQCTILEAAEDVAKLFVDHPPIKLAAYGLSAFYNLINPNGKLQANINPNDVLKTIGCGKLLVESIKTIRPNSETLKETEELLVYLLHCIENPGTDPKHLEFIQIATVSQFDIEEDIIAPKHVASGGSNDVSGSGKENNHAYTFIKTFLVEISSSLKLVHKFIHDSVDAIKGKNIQVENRKAIYDKSEKTYKLLEDIIDKLKRIIERESEDGSTIKSLLIKAGVDVTGDERITRYRQVVTKCLEQARLLQHGLKVLLSVTNENSSSMSIISEPDSNICNKVLF